MPSCSMWPSNKDITLFVGVPVIMTHPVDALIVFLCRASFLGLADRTKYGRSRPYLVRSRLCDRLRPSVYLSSVALCIVAKRCVLEQKLLLTAYRKSYEKSIGTKMNDFDLCLEVVSRSCQVSTIALHSTLNISETVSTWFQRTTNMVT